MIILFFKCNNPIKVCSARKENWPKLPFLYMRIVFMFTDRLCFFAFIFLVGPLLPLHGVYLVRLWVNFVLYFIPLILSNCWLFVRNFLWCHIYPAVYCIWDMVGLCTILISLCVHFCLAALYILGLGCQGQLDKLAIHCSMQASSHTWSQLQIRINVNISY